jgi:hemolysin III
VRYISGVMKPSETALPNYTRTQENWNCLSHASGTLFTLIAGPFLLVKAIATGDPYRIVSSVLFIIALLILYTGSALYHGYPASKTKRVLRVLDHNNVFILIMGTYAPYCLSLLRSFSVSWAYGIYGSCLVLGIVGIILNSIDLQKFRIVSMVDYLLMGWLIVLSLWPMSQAMGFYPGVFLLLIGGLFYTVGAVFYGIGGKKNQWWHLVFHIFCLVGTISMFFSIYYFVI